MRWLWLILLSISVKAQQPFTILVDQTLGQPVYPFDEGPSGLSWFIGFAESEEISVIPIAENLDSHLVKTNNTLLILTPTINRSYKAETVKNIQQFVKNGGKLLVFTEHENYYNNSAELNRITEEFGIKTLPDGYKKGAELRDVWLKAKCPKYKVNDIDFYYTATLKLSKKAKPFVTIDKAIVAASAIYGKGKAIVIADYEMAWNFAVYNEENNNSFLFGLFKELYCHWPNIHWPTYPPAIISTPTNNYKIIFKGRRDFYTILKSLKLKYTLPNDTLRIQMFHPHDNFFSIEDTIDKYLFVADGSSNYWLPIKNMGGQYVLDELKYEERETNTNKAAALFGLHFGQKTLIDTCINSYKITLQPGNQKASCVGYIDTLQTGHYTVVYTTNATAVDYNAPLGGEEFSPNYCYANTANKQQYIVALYNKRVFAIADMELFQNMKSNPYLLNAFQDWINLH